MPSSKPKRKRDASASTEFDRDLYDVNDDFSFPSILPPGNAEVDFGRCTSLRFPLPESSKDAPLLLNNRSCTFFSESGPAEIFHNEHVNPLYFPPVLPKWNLLRFGEPKQEWFENVLLNHQPYLMSRLSSLQIDVRGKGALTATDLRKLPEHIRQTLVSDLKSNSPDIEYNGSCFSSFLADPRPPFYNESSTFCVFPSGKRMDRLSMGILDLSTQPSVRLCSSIRMHASILQIALSGPLLPLPHRAFSESSSILNSLPEYSLPLGSSDVPDEFPVIAARTFDRITLYQPRRSIESHVEMYTEYRLEEINAFPFEHRPFCVSLNLHFGEAAVVTVSLSFLLLLLFFSLCFLFWFSDVLECIALHLGF